MIDPDSEIVAVFLEESRENLDQLDLDLVTLERDPSDVQLLAQVFRTIHTIKGTCGFLGFVRLEALTHAGESLLGALRSGELQLDPAITTSLLALVDAVRHILNVIERTGTEGEEDHRRVIAALDRHLAPTSAGPVIELAEAMEAAYASRVAAAAETTVRVDVAILDKLMDLVGELVLTRSQFGESASTDDDGPLSLPYRQLRLLTNELQESVMRARLQPLGTITRKLRRVVRDLAAVMGKQVAIELEGEEIDVDKAVNEALSDPLLHLVRNAVDHGIELPHERLAAGKPAVGTVTLRASHKSGRVHIELTDDGRGVDPARLIQRAIATGLLTPDEAVALSPDEAVRLMFLPGLSTKDAVTNISGRGVGMDVVRSALEHVGGHIGVSFEPGRGTVFHLTVPLTLTIMPVLIAAVGAQRFAVPRVDVQEIVHLAADEIATTIDDVDGALLHRRRGRLLPLVDLAAQLRLEPATGRDVRTDLTIIVLESAGRLFGVVVDHIEDATDVVVKPLTPAIRSIRVFGGVSILKDGTPALILDVAGLAADSMITAVPAPVTLVADIAPSGMESTFLLASGIDGSRIAVETAVVRRLHEIASESIERSGTLEVVRYQGGILPLIRVAPWGADGAPPAPVNLLQTIVCEASIGLVGLVVGRIEDVVEEPRATPQPLSRRGVIATLVVNDRVADLIDIETLVADAGLGVTA